MAADIERRLRAIIAEVAKQETAEVRPHEDLAERLGIDSLQGLQILAAVETRFDVRLPDEELPGLRTIEGIVQAIRRGGES